MLSPSVDTVSCPFSDGLEYTKVKSVNRADEPTTTELWRLASVSGVDVRVGVGGQVASRWTTATFCRRSTDAAYTEHVEHVRNASVAEHAGQHVHDADHAEYGRTHQTTYQ